MSKIDINKESCVHCGACTAVCNSKALQMESDTWTLCFTKSSCTGCESCIEACPLRAIIKV